ncbi:MAG: acetate/propionate family kinase, partial [Clostridia bacterium]|nr:acetate/propionate family kinase [Clostridia bacterium]
MKILILNAGSSSLKYQLIDMDGEKLLAKGIAERIGIEGSKISQKAGEKSFEREEPMKDHTAAIELMLKALTDPQKGALSSMDEIAAVGHRVVHGGERFTASVRITQEVKDAVRAIIPMSPLHNPANLMGIEACEKVMPNTPNVGVFDTAFHQTMPKKAYIYGVPMEYYRRLRVRRYGFHGTSHRYVSKRACDFLGLNRSEARVITCHLGNGSSLAAVDCGKCVDTSMGLTPLEGIIMGSRTGSIDPAVVPFIMKKTGFSPAETEDFLNKKCGLLGVSGVSSDMREVTAAKNSGNENAALAIDILCYGI